MELALESVLKQRSRQLAGRLERKRSFLMSAGLHLVLISSLIILPILLRKTPEPIEFTPITIVPVQALGVETPVAPPSRAEAPPKPEPEKALSPAKTESKPETTALPSLEKKAEKKPPTQTSSTPAETAPTSAATTQGQLGQRRGSAQGSSLGSSAFGAAVGGLDNPDFVYGYYVDKMLAMIGGQWQRPPLGADIEAIVHFRIHRDGHISDVRVVQSSGYNSYDLAGLRAVQTAAPFPKLPQSFKHSSLGVNLILR